MDAAGARRTVFMDSDDAIHGHEDSYVQNPLKHPVSGLARLVRAPGLDGGAIGVELDNYHYSTVAGATLREALGADRLVDATGLVNWQRAVKSPAEIEYMRRIGAIVTHMHERIVEMAEPGLPKNLLVSEILRLGAEGAGASERQTRDRADDALGPRYDGAAPDWGRPAAAPGEGHVLRDRGHPPALSLPAIAHAVPGRGVRALQAGGKGGAGRIRGGPVGGAPGGRNASRSRAPSTTRWPLTASSRTAAAATRSG